jgi:hypothetical protein
MDIVVYEMKSQRTGLDANEVQIANVFPFVYTWFCSVGSRLMTKPPQ